MGGKTVTQIKTKYCPFCKEEHFVEYRGTLLVQMTNEDTLRVYRCPKYNREFRTSEKE